MYSLCFSMFCGSFWIDFERFSDIFVLFLESLGAFLDRLCTVFECFRIASGWFSDLFGPISNGFQIFPRHFLMGFGRSWIDFRCFSHIFVPFVESFRVFSIDFQRFSDI